MSPRSAECVSSTFTSLQIGFRPIGPVQRINPTFNVAMKHRIRPIRNPFDIALFERIDGAIIDVCRIVPVVADCVFPKPALP